MITEMYSQQPGETNSIKKSQRSATRLSDQAFYLIVLAKLFKKEFGVSLLKQYFTMEGPTAYPGRSAA
jgi:hypothetical protein